MPLKKRAFVLCVLLFFSCSEHRKIAPSLLKKISTDSIEAVPVVKPYRVGVLYRTKTYDFVSADATDIMMLAAKKDVVAIEEDYTVRTTLIYATKQIGARDVWAQGYTGSTFGGTSNDIGIAVLDTGLDSEHLDFSDPGKIIKIVNCYNVSTCVESSQNDDNGHGTHVAGIVLV